MLKFEVEVWFGDLDSFGHVNNVVIARYLETARVKYFLSRFGNFGKLEQGFVLRRIEIDYLSPLYLGETAVVEIWVERVGNTSFDFGYRIYERESRREIARAKSVQVWYDLKKNQKIPIPDEVREVMLKDLREGE